MENLAERLQADWSASGAGPLRYCSRDAARARHDDQRGLPAPLGEPNGSGRSAQVCRRSAA